MEWRPFGSERGQCRCKLSPNPPIDGVRTAEGGEGATGEMAWAHWDRLEVGGRSKSPDRVPMAVCGSCDARDARESAAGNSRRPGWCEFSGTLGQLQAGLQAGSGMARNRAKARLNWVSQGQRWGRCRVRRRAERVVHHSVILEFDVPSYRTGVAQQRSQKQGVNRQE